LSFAPALVSLSPAKLQRTGIVASSLRKESASALTVSGGVLWFALSGSSRTIQAIRHAGRTGPSRRSWALPISFSPRRSQLVAVLLGRAPRRVAQLGADDGVAPAGLDGREVLQRRLPPGDDVAGGHDDGGTGRFDDLCQGIEGLDIPRVHLALEGMARASDVFHGLESRGFGGGCLFVPVIQVEEERPDDHAHDQHEDAHEPEQLPHSQHLRDLPLLPPTDLAFRQPSGRDRRRHGRRNLYRDGIHLLLQRLYLAVEVGGALGILSTLDPRDDLLV
jgi:hypothetical protein